VAGFGAVLGTLGAALVLGATLALAHLYGSRIESIRELAGMGVRSVLPVIALAVLGFCIGLVTRHTAGAIVVLLATLLISFVRSGALSSQEWAQRITPWTPEGNLAAIVDRGYTYAVPVKKVTPDGVITELVERGVSFTHGLIYWALLLALVVMASLLIFRRRDVV
jgi:ABC-2 type transport system permease protein